MARPKKPIPSVRLTVSLDSEVHELLSVMAEENDVSLAWLVRKALRDFLDEDRKSVHQNGAKSPKVELVKR